MVEQVSAALEREGYKSRCVSVAHVEDLRKELEGHYEEGRMSDEIHEMLLRYLRFGIPNELPDAKSIFVVSAQSPRTVFYVNWRGRRLPVQVPPTYADQDAMIRRSLEIIRETLKPAGYTAVNARLPVKALAVHSGLARYGKNNITYVEGWGSYQRLAVFFSDVLCEADNWPELRMMERCNSCNACEQACPTGAIHGDWVIIRAERCLCHLNEGPREFPDWVDPAWHDSIIGCLHCQKVCPENASVLHKVVEGPEFTSEETAEILKARSADDISPATLEKLRTMGLHYYTHAIARNLRVLVEQTNAAE